MSRTNVFGPLVNPHHVSRAVRDHIKKWIDTYLAEVERSDGAALTYARPVSYPMTNLLDVVLGQDLQPAIITVTRGANRPPERQGRSYNLPLDVGVAVVTASYGDDGAREAAGAYAAALTGLMLHKPNLEGAMEGSLRVASWDDMRMDDLTAEEQRARALLRLEFTVLAKDVARDGPAGPDIPNPPADPTVDPGPWPTVATHTVTLIKEDNP